MGLLVVGSDCTSDLALCVDGKLELFAIGIPKISAQGFRHILLIQHIVVAIRGNDLFAVLCVIRVHLQADHIAEGAAAFGSPAKGGRTNRSVQETLRLSFG